VSGSGLRLVISHPDSALYIQLPTLAATVAVQTIVECAVPKRDPRGSASFCGCRRRSVLGISHASHSTARMDAGHTRSLPGRSARPENR
jgi:hypothetical protein